MRTSTDVLRVDPERPDRGAIAHAAEVLRRGGLVAFPTETVYGLGARATDERAVRRIFDAKGRPPDNPLIVHLADLEGVPSVCSSWPREADLLARAFWPGPLTLIVPRSPIIPDVVTAGGDTVALRIPSHPVALALLAACGFPVAAPSANPSRAISPTTAAHVKKGLLGKIDLLLDAGPTARGIESTVVDVTVRPAVVLRPGALPRDVISEVVSAVGAPAEDEPGGGVARSPGRRHRHYAPRAATIVVAIDEVESRVRALAGRGQRVGVIERGWRTSSAAEVEVLPLDPEGYAAELYAALHRLEDAGCDAIVIAGVPTGARWDAVRDRISRARET